ncbi:RtcB family protein [Lysinibacillus sp. MHQ-1]|nr:RtcB family protein [Lysinibacillus sp. MHQ-1]
MLSFERIYRVVKRFIRNYRLIDIFLAFEGKQFKATGLKDEYTNLSLGTLGGGNHFIELAKDEENQYYLLIHTGSRYVGGKSSKLASKKGPMKICVSKI